MRWQKNTPSLWWKSSSSQPLHRGQEAFKACWTRSDNGEDEAWASQLLFYASSHWCDPLTSDYAFLLKLLPWAVIDATVLSSLPLNEPSWSTFMTSLLASIFVDMPESQFRLPFLHRTSPQQFSCTWAASPSAVNQAALEEMKRNRWDTEPQR